MIYFFAVNPSLPNRAYKLLIEAGTHTHTKDREKGWGEQTFNPLSLSRCAVSRHLLLSVVFQSQRTQSDSYEGWGQALASLSTTLATLASPLATMENNGWKRVLSLVLPISQHHLWQGRQRHLWSKSTRDRCVPIRLSASAEK